MQERAKDLKSALDEAKNSYESLKSTMSNYQNAKEGLDKLTKGTTEWKE
jgi:predicted  nucleic acid-binding Zn-ribbon protein